MLTMVRLSALVLPLAKTSMLSSNSSSAAFLSIQPSRSIWLPKVMVGRMLPTLPRSYMRQTRSSRWLPRLDTSTSTLRLLSLQMVPRINMFKWRPFRTMSVKGHSRYMTILKVLNVKRCEVKSRLASASSRLVTLLVRGSPVPPPMSTVILSSLDHSCVCTYTTGIQ